MSILLAGSVVKSASAPPTTQPAAQSPLPVQSTVPQPSSRSTLVPVPCRPYFPPATVGHDPRALPADGARPLHAGPALDIPPLAATAVALPAEPELPVGPPIQIASEDSAALPVATLAAKPDIAAATLTTDPTIGLARAGALLLTPPPRTSSPPALLLPIPDPSHQIGSIATKSPATEDPPATDIDPPGPTTLPVTGQQ